MLVLPKNFFARDFSVEALEACIAPAAAGGPDPADSDDFLDNLLADPDPVLMSDSLPGVLIVEARLFEGNLEWLPFSR